MREQFLQVQEHKVKNRILKKNLIESLTSRQRGLTASDTVLGCTVWLRFGYGFFRTWVLFGPYLGTVFYVFGYSFFRTWIVLGYGLGVLGYGLGRTWVDLGLSYLGAAWVVLVLGVV